MNFKDWAIFVDKCLMDCSGTALVFNGISDCVLGSSSPFDFENTTFSVCEWFRTTDSVGVLVAEGGYAGGWFLGIVNEGKVKVMLKASPEGEDAYTADIINAYNNDEWYHVTAVITTSTTSVSGNHADIYVNGSLVSTTEVESLCYGSSTYPWNIGYRLPSPRPDYFMGLIDEVRIYQRALSKAEIKYLYENP